jgi:transposase-like protein
MLFFLVGPQRTLTNSLLNNTIEEIGNREYNLMQITIKCPACNSDSSFFVVKNAFQGPFRCWKCRGLFTLKVRNGETQLCEPLSQEDFDKQKADKEARRKKSREKTA